MNKSKEVLAITKGKRPWQWVGRHGLFKTKEN